MRCRVAAFLLLPALALAEVAVEVQPGLHGVVRAHRWGFLSVSLTSDGAEDTSGEVQVTLPQDAHVYVRKVDLPARKRAHVNVYFRMRDLQTEVNVRWVDAKGNEWKRTAQLPGGNREPYFLAAVWSSRPNVQDLALGGFVNHPVLATDELPDHWEGYDALDALVIDAPEVSSMTPAQSRALVEWMECGGRILVVGEPTWTPHAVDPYIAQLLPCSLEGGTEANVPAVFPGVQSGSTISSVLKVSLHPRAFCLNSADIDGRKVSLWIREPRGCGLAEFLPFHPRQLTFLKDSKGSPRSGPFWGQGLIGHDGTPKDFDQRVPTEAFVPFLTEPKQTPEDPIGTVTIFALVYAVIVGPGVFWFQRRYRNLLTRALTFPAAVAGFTVLAFLLNQALKLRSLGGTRVTLVYGTEGGRGARGTTYFSFISPSEGGFVVQAPHDGARFSVLPRGGDSAVRMNVVRIEGWPGHEVHIAMRPWIPESFVCDWRGDVETGIVSHLRWSEGRLQGTIENTSETKLEDVRLAAKGWLYPGKATFEVAGKGTSPRIDVGNGPRFSDLWPDCEQNQLLQDFSDDGNRRNWPLAGQAYALFALVPPGKVPFPQPKDAYSMSSLWDRELDNGTLTVAPIVEPFSDEVVLLGWRSEDRSGIDVTGRGVEWEDRTMYALRLEVARGR